MTTPTRDLVGLLCRANFRDMTMNDYAAFAGAPDGSRCAAVGGVWMIIWAPTDDDGGPDHFEFHRVGDDGEPICWSLRSDRLI